MTQRRFPTPGERVRIEAVELETLGAGLQREIRHQASDPDCPIQAGAGVVISYVGLVGGEHVYRAVIWPAGDEAS